MSPLSIEIDSSVQSVVDRDGVLNKYQLSEWERLLNGLLDVPQIESLLTGILDSAYVSGLVPNYFALLSKEELGSESIVRFYTFGSKRLVGWQGFKLVSELSDEVLYSVSPESSGLGLWVSSVRNVVLSRAFLVRTVVLSSALVLVLSGFWLLFGRSGEPTGSRDGFSQSSGSRTSVSVKTASSRELGVSEGGRKPVDVKREDKRVSATSVFKSSDEIVRSDNVVSEKRVSNTVVERPVPKPVPLVPVESYVGSSSGSNGGSVGHNGGSRVFDVATPAPSVSKPVKPSYKPKKSESSSGVVSSSNSPVLEVKPSTDKGSDLDKKPSSETEVRPSGSTTSKPADASSKPVESSSSTSSDSVSSPATSDLSTGVSSGSTGESGSSGSAGSESSDNGVVAPAESSGDSVVESWGVDGEVDSSPSEVPENWNF